MRADTVVYWAVNHVGAPDDAVVVIHGTMAECFMGLARYFGARSMKERFDMVMARNEESALKALKSAARKQTESQVEDTIAQVMSIMDEINQTGELA